MKRAVITPTLVTVGLLVALGGEVESGVTIGLVAMGYWVVVGWSRPWRRAGSKRASRHASDVVTVVGQGARSDGVGGAFARLQPEMRTWLEDELQARRNDPSARLAQTR